MLNCETSKTKTACRAEGRPFVNETPHKAFVMMHVSSFVNEIMWRTYSQEVRYALGRANRVSRRRRLTSTEGAPTVRRHSFIVVQAHGNSFQKKNFHPKGDSNGKLEIITSIASAPQCMYHQKRCEAIVWRASRFRSPKYGQKSYFSSTNCTPLFFYSSTSW